MNDLDLREWIRGELFERTPNNIAILDREFCIVEANHNFTETYGEWKNRHCYEVYGRPDRECPSCMARLTFADGKGRVSEEHRLNKQRILSYHVVHFEPIVDRNGEIPYVLEISHDVTENRIRRREHDVLFDRVPCYIVVLNRDMVIVRNNELFRKTFGESLGKKCYKAFQRRDEICENCPAHRTFLDGKVHRADGTGRSIAGKVVHCHKTSAPLSPGEENPSHVMELCLDTTDIHVLEAQLKEAFNLQQSLIDSAIDSIVAADGNGAIRIFNPSAENLLRYRPKEVLGRRMIKRFVPTEFLDSLVADEPHCVLDETLTYDRDGNAIPVRFSGVALKGGGKTIGSAAFFQDLRAIKQLEREKLEAERMAAVGQTVAGLAHGIKNVLMGLEGGMYVVNSGMRKDDKELIRKGWEMLQGNIERITAYVKDFLGFAKSRTPKVEIVNPNDVVTAVVELYKDRAAQAGIEILTEFQDGIQPANLDAEGMYTCLTNLVSNAIDACEMSGKTGCKVNIRTFERDDTLVFEVRDDGCGMDPDVQQKAFTTFFSTKGLSKGTGLGLLVTRRITQEHGGTVTFRSTEGKGSLFRIELPRRSLPPLTSTHPQDSTQPRQPETGG